MVIRIKIEAGNIRTTNFLFVHQQILTYTYEFTKLILWYRKRKLINFQTSHDTRTMKALHSQIIQQQQVNVNGGLIKWNVYLINGWQLAKMKKSIPDMSLP